MKPGIPSGWEAIRDELRRRIGARHWPPGTLMPTEIALAKEFGVARGTVNRALAELAEGGLIERRKRAGTRVAALPVRQARIAIPIIRNEIAARGQRPSHRIVTQDNRAAPVTVATRMGAAALIYLETLYLGDDRPFALEQRWLNHAVLPGLVPDFETLSANEWLVANVPFLGGDLAFSAEPAGPHEAAILGIETGTAVFVTERMTRGPVGPITLVRLVHMPGYRVQTAL